MANAKQLVYLTQEQYAELLTNGTVTSNGVTVIYNENDIYATPQAEVVTSTMLAPNENDLVADRDYTIGDIFTANGKVYKVTAEILTGAAIVTAGNNTNCEETSIANAFVKNTDYATTSKYGVVKIGSGLYADSNGFITIDPAASTLIKMGAGQRWPITPLYQHQSTFYGLAKAAGDTTQSQSSNAVGTYTPEAKTAIRSMIGAADADELNDKANRDGYYSEMTVGNAEQLVSSKFVEDQEPYTLRPAGGSADIGNRENLTAIVGGTLAWNQQVRDEASDNVTEFADIVTVDDAVADNSGVKVKIEPVQDLHGYDHPWPAGGGKNLFDQEVYSNISAYSVSFSSYYYTEPPLMLKPNTQYTFSPDSNSDLDAGLYFAVRTKDGDTFSSDDAYIYPVYNGSVTTSTRHTITTGSTGKIVFGLPNGSDAGGRLSKIMSKNWQLEEGSTATAWAPYENICPISGWTGVDIFTAGENLVPAEDKDYTGTNKNTRLTCENGIFTLANVQPYPLGVTALISQQSGTVETVFEKRKRLLPGTYSFSVEITGLVGTTDVTSISLKLTDYIVEDKVSIANGGTFTITEPLDIRAIACQCVGGYPVGASISFKVQLERSTSPSTWKPYSGQTYSITFPSEAGTVYGGSLTVNEDGTGSLMADRASFVLDGDTSKFQLPSSWYGADAERGSIGFYWYFSYTGFNGLPKPKTYSSYADIVGNLSSDKLLLRQFGVYNVDDWYTFGIPTSAIYIAIRLPKEALSDASTDLASKESCMEWLRNNPVQFCYKIAEPITYPLTASQVTTLLGTNNVWADAGQVSLTYKGTDEHLTLTDGRKYMTRINGVDSMVLGAGQAVTAVKGRDNVFDLTQMFGTAAVADYVYGQGASFFRKWFQNSVYAYNPGELKSVEGLQSHDTVGFNLLEDDVISGELVSYSNRMPDEKWQRLKVQLTRLKQLGQTLFYRVESSTTSTSGIPIGSIKFWNNSENAMLPFTLQSNALNNLANLDLEKADAAYIYGSNIVSNIVLSNACISLANNGSRNGEYEPYEKHSYPLDPSVVLRGVPKLIDGKPGWDGDRYLPDGTVERRYGVIDLGSLTWTWMDMSSYSYFYSTISSALGSNDNIVPNMFISNGMPVVSFADRASLTTALACYQKQNKQLQIRYTAYTDAVAFKAAMSGVYLVYELATPTTETAEPYRELQIVDDWGTEEFVSTGLVPVGHTTQYPANLRDKLQHLPDLASSNGIYIVKQTDSEMELMRLPDMPTANGNYRLKLNVASGSPTFSWEAVT